MNLIYGIKDKPKFAQLLLFAFQQVLAILAATITVPAMVGHGMTAAAALFGAGVGTIVYQLFTKFRSPVFLGSSFAFIGPMVAAFAGGVSMSLGYLGLILGAVFAGLVYVIIALVVKFAGVKWIDKVMPAAVIGPTVALIGLSLAGAAINDVFSYGAKITYGVSSYFVMDTRAWVSLACAMVTLFVVVLVSTYGKKMAKLIPFIIGIFAGYVVATIFTLIGENTGNEALKVIDFTLFQNLTIFKVPEFTFLEGIKGASELYPKYIATIAVAYIPVAFVVFAEHLADHKNLSSIIDSDLLKEPGLHRTLLGDGIGSMAGAFFGGCPNTTYGESVGCVAITKNASIVTITTAAVMCHHFLLWTLRCLSGFHSRLRNGRCLHHPVRLHRLLRSEDDPEGGSEPEQEPVRGRFHSDPRHRRYGYGHRQGHPDRHRLRSDPGHHRQPGGFQG